MSAKIHAFDLIRTAGGLLSEDGEGYEYDRAIVELVHAMLDMDADADKDTTARLLRGAAGRDTSIGLVEPAAEPGLYLPEQAVEDASLSDCYYWDRPEADCGGPRMFKVAGTRALLCETHLNNDPMHA